MRRSVLIVLSIALSGLSAVPQAAAAAVPLPEDATILFPGHGWGHGRGMGQWGAKGMADAGNTYRQILSHYYSGITYGARPATEDIRVLVRESSSVVITSDTPFSISWSSGAAVATSDTTYRYWRARWDGTVYHVERATAYSGPWSAVTTGSTYIWFKPGSSLLQVVSTDGSSHYYRGTIFARQIPNAIRAVNVLTMQQYLYGVVPRESPASWPAEELKAQAVAARSYAAYKKDSQRAKGYWYDICTTTSCQSYGGQAWKTSPSASKTVLEYSSSNAAVDSTAGVTLLYSGKAILAEYSSSTGGYTAPGSVPYESPVTDPSDSVSPLHNWTGKVKTSEIEARWPALGRLVNVTVTKRNGYGDWGGRVLTMSLVGTASTVTLSGSAFASAFSADGLRGDWFRPLYYRGDLSSASSSLVVQQGSLTIARVQIKNTGTLWWPVGGIVRIAAASTRFYGSDWISTSRVASVAANVTSPATKSVGPGQVAEFRIPIHAEGVPPGTYSERFTAVADGSSSMTPTFTMAVQVLTGWVDEGPNLVTNASFESNSWGWAGSGLKAGDGPTTTTAREGSRSFALTGGGSKVVSQTIALAGGARRFTLGGWNRSTGSSSSGGAIELLATARYSDGTASSWALPFARAAHLWSYAETSFATDAKKSVASIRVSAVYSNQSGTGYFDAIRLQETPIVDSSFERGLTGWSTTGFGTSDGPVTGAPDGYHSLAMVGASGSKSVSQALTLSGAHSERFILSAWTRTTGTNPSGGPITAALTMFAADGTTSVGTLEFARGAHGWTYSENEIQVSKAFVRARLTLSTSAQSGTVFFDDVRVTRSWTHNASFESGLTGWSGYGLGSGDGTSQVTARDGATSLRLTGNARTGLVQSVAFGGRAGQRFVLSGWIRTSSTSASGGSIAYVAVFRNTDGSSTWFTLPTIKGTHPWLYGETLLVAPKPFSALGVYAIFYDQSGSAYFDGIRIRSA
jgi:stage II sporulation protein D